MEIWLDTSDTNLAAKTTQLGILHGITTNPSILSLSKTPLLKLINQMLEVQRGLLALQVTSEDVGEICKQAKALAAISSRIVIKIPVTQNGIQAIYALSQEGIPTLATAVFELRQALLAFKAGACYLAPYLGRIADTGNDPIKIITQMHSMKLRYGFHGKIMGAGIRNLTAAISCIEVGICAVTLSEKIFKEFVAETEPTLKAIETFSKDWSSSIYSKIDLSTLNSI